MFFFVAVVKYLLLCSSKIQNFDEIDPAVCIYTKKAVFRNRSYSIISIFPSSMRRENETTLLNGTFYAMVLVVL